MEKKLFKKIDLKNISAKNAVFLIVFIIFAIYSASLVYTLIYAFINSLKSPSEYFDFPFGMPKDWLVINYLHAFTELSVEGTGFISMMINSLWWSFGHVFVSLSVITLFAYVMAKYNFKLRGFVWGINLFIIMIPIYGNLSATFSFYADLNFLNSPLILIAAASGFGTNSLIIMAYFKGIPWNYAEAAFIDGAGHFKVFFSIMVPIALPSIFAIGLVQFISVWNDYMGPLLYMDKFPTLSSGLYLYRIYSVERQGNYPIYFSGLLIAIIPVMIIHAFFSETIMTNVGIGGIKG